MTENAPDQEIVSAPQAPPVQLGTFEVTPYKPDGWYSIPSMMQLCGALGLTGIILGVVASFIGQYFWFVLLFPLAIGFGIGFVGAVLVNRFHIRSPWICSLAGLCAGLFAMLAIHFTSFRMYESSLNSSIDPGVLAVARNIENIKAQQDQLSPEIQELITEMEKEPEMLAAFQVDTFPEYMEYSARAGVEIGKTGRGINLGYTGTWIYWGIEALIVAGVALVLMKSASENPYCTASAKWKAPLRFGPFPHTEENVNNLKAGRLQTMHPSQGDGTPDFFVLLHPSPDFENEEPVDVFLEKITVDKEGNVNSKSFAKLTYPGQAYVPLLLACGVTLEETQDDPSDEEDQDPSDDHAAT